jgi:Protein of unknown function (DUF3302)
MTFLDYFALFLLCLSLTAVFFLFIYIHDLPYKIAKERDHPQAEAIGVAQWLALFTLEALWPLVFIWAVSYRKPSGQTPGSAPAGEGDLATRLAALEDRLRKLEGIKS